MIEIMPPIISFQEAIAKTEGENRTLLIGNGFSSQYFNYKNLLEKYELDATPPVRQLFDKLDTKDFEKVVRALEDASIVAKAYGREDQAAELISAAQQVREALVKAINATHPPYRDELAFNYPSSAAFLANFQNVFSLNYDLLLYWVNLYEGRLQDGFLGADNLPGGKFRAPFSEGVACNIYNLHGGLHLFEGVGGTTMKALNNGDGVISTITDVIANNKRFPIYVAEGTSEAKMEKIRTNDYLRHCYKKLQENSATVFVYGHSADENDTHIYSAIFLSGAKHLFFGIYKPDDEKLKRLNGQLAKYQKTTGSKVDYTFFDAETAQVWNAP